MSSNVMSDEVENDWTWVKRGRRAGSRQAKIRADHAEGPTESKHCRRDRGPEVSNESAQAAKIHQLPEPGNFRTNNSSDGDFFQIMR